MYYAMYEKPSHVIEIDYNFTAYVVRLRPSKPKLLRYIAPVGDVFWHLQGLRLLRNHCNFYIQDLQYANFLNINLVWARLVSKSARIVLITYLFERLILARPGPFQNGTQGLDPMANGSYGLYKYHICRAGESYWRFHPCAHFVILQGANLKCKIFIDTIQNIFLITFYKFLLNMKQPAQFRIPSCPARHGATNNVSFYRIK